MIKSARIKRKINKVKTSRNSAKPKLMVKNQKSVENTKLENSIALQDNQETDQEFSPLENSIQFFPVESTKPQ